MKKILFLSLLTVNITLLPMTSYNITVKNLSDGLVIVELKKTAPGHANPKPLAGKIAPGDSMTFNSGDGVDGFVDLYFTYPNGDTGMVTAKKCQNKFRIEGNEHDRNYNWHNDYGRPTC